MTVGLTGAQVTRVREAVDRYQGNMASRGGHLHIEAEELVTDILEIVQPQQRGTEQQGAPAR